MENYFPIETITGRSQDALFLIVSIHLSKKFQGYLITNFQIHWSLVRSILSSMCRSRFFSPIEVFIMHSLGYWSCVQNFKQSRLLHFYALVLCCSSANIDAQVHRTNIFIYKTGQMLEREQKIASPHHRQKSIY